MTILKNLETFEILQKENLSLLQVRETRDYFSKELEDVINVAECESHPWSNIQFWSSFHRKRESSMYMTISYEPYDMAHTCISTWEGCKCLYK